MGDASAFVVDEAVIGRAARRDQPTDRQLWIAGHVGDPILGSGLSDVECLAAEQRLQHVSDAKWQPSDGRDDPEPLVLHVGPQPDGQFYGGRGLAAGNHDRPKARAKRAEKSCAPTTRASGCPHPTVGTHVSTGTDGIQPGALISDF